MNFTVDTTAPNLSITSPYGGYYSSSSTVSVVWTGNDATSGLLGFQYQIDSGSWSTTALVNSRTFANLTDGSHTVNVKAYDNIGNVVTRTVAFDVDTSVPTVRITSPSPNSITNETAITVVWEGSDATGGIAGYMYKIDNGGWSGLTSSTSYTFLGMRDGRHSFVVEVIDHANNAAVDVLNFTVVDTVPPVLNILGPAQSAFLGSSTVHVTWNATDATSGVQGYYYRIGGGAWSSMTTSNDATFLSLQDGTYTVDIMAIDNANNSIVRSVTFVVDMTAPSLSITSPAQMFNSDSSTVKVIWFAYDATSGLTGYQYRIDNGTWCSLTQAISHDFGGLAEGRHTADVRCMDRSGNNATVSVTFVVDTVVPQVSILSPTDGSYSMPTVTVRASASDPTTGISGFQFRIDGQAWTEMSGTANCTFVNVPDGMHTVDVEAYDGAGNWARSTTTFTVDSTKPAIHITSPASGSLYPSSSFTVSWVGSDSVSGVAGYQYRLDSGNWSSESSASSHLFSGLKDGNHTIDVRVFDRAGNNDSESIIVGTDTAVPLLHILSPADNFNTTSSSILCSWTGSDNMSGIAYYEYRLDGSGWFGPVSSTSTTLVSVPDGHHLFVVEAYDLAGNMAEAMVNFTTDSYPPNLSIVSINISGPVGDRTAVIGWTGSDLNSGVAGYQCRLDSGNWTAKSMNLTCTFQGLAEGYHTVSVRAYDHAGNVASQTDGFYIGGGAPTVFAITSPGWYSTFTTHNVTVSWALFQSYPLDHYETKLDTGLWTNEGLLTSQSFTGLSEGWHTVYVRTVDGNGSSITDSVEFVVDTINPMLTITSPSNGVAIDSPFITISCSASDASSGLNCLLYNLDGDGWSSATLSLSASFYLTEGPHRVDVALTTTPAIMSPPRSTSRSISWPRRSDRLARRGQLLQLLLADHQLPRHRWQLRDPGYQFNLDSQAWTARQSISAIR